MSGMRVFPWLITGGLLVAAAAFFTHRYEVTDHLLAMFLSLNPTLPPWMSFEQFLVMVIVVCGLLVAVVIALALVGVVLMRRSVHQAWRKQVAIGGAVEHAVDQLKVQVHQEYERLIGLSSTLTQRLDKRALIQNILKAASQITSLPQADSTVGLWALDFETDRMRFEMGLRCDETFFTKPQFELTEPPFVRLVASPQLLSFGHWQEGFPFVKPEKAAQLGVATALILVPLVIERTVLGCVVVFCHPDLLKGYDEEQAFFNAAWGMLSLALAIAIQGELAILDRLTGVVNHAYFLKRLAQEIERSNRYQLSLGLLMIDIDNFKAINDTLGHPQGDEVLKRVAKLIKQGLRAIDLVGRYGGEEFIVLLPETGSAEGPGGSSGAMVVAERIRKAIEEEFHGSQKPMAVTVSIGVATRRYPQDRDMDAQELVRLADEQLYKAKQTGKNRCCVYMPAPHQVSGSRTAAGSATPRFGDATPGSGNKHIGAGPQAAEPVS